MGRPIRATLSASSHPSLAPKDRLTPDERVDGLSSLENLDTRRLGSDQPAPADAEVITSEAVAHQAHRGAVPRAAPKSRESSVIGGRPVGRA